MFFKNIFGSQILLPLFYCYELSDWYWLWLVHKVYRLYNLGVQWLDSKSIEMWITTKQLPSWLIKQEKLMRNGNALLNHQPTCRLWPNMHPKNIGLLSSTRWRSRILSIKCNVPKSMYLPTAPCIFTCLNNFLTDSSLLLIN